MSSPPPRKPAKLPRAARGPRPAFFEDPASDTLLSMNVALLTELMTTRERLDTLERLMVRKGFVTHEEIDAFETDAAGETEREQSREQMTQRVFYLLLQQAERAARD